MAKKRLKPLLPSLREKKRYLAFEAISDEMLESGDVAGAIHQSCLRLMGELGMANAGIIFLDDKFQDNKGIIRVNNRYVNHLKASLMLINNIRDNEAVLRSTGVSGILKKAEDRYLA